jgi:hypothetical protein
METESVNWELLQKVYDAAVENRDSFDMRSWGGIDGDVDMAENELYDADPTAIGATAFYAPTSRCGTTACLAGWTVFLAEEGKYVRKMASGNTIVSSGGCVDELAADLLRIRDSKVADGLFMTFVWQKEQYTLWAGANSMESYVTIFRPKDCHSDEDWVLDYLGKCLKAREMLRLEDLYEAGEE